MTESSFNIEVPAGVMEEVYVYRAPYQVLVPRPLVFEAAGRSDLSDTGIEILKQSRQNFIRAVSPIPPLVRANSKRPGESHRPALRGLTHELAVLQAQNQSLDDIFRSCDCILNVGVSHKGHALKVTLVLFEVTILIGEDRW